MMMKLMKQHSWLLEIQTWRKKMMLLSLYPGTPRPEAHDKGLTVGHICHMLARVRGNQDMAFQLTPNVNDATRVVSYFSTNESSDSWLLKNGLTHHLCNDADIFRFLVETYNSKVKVGNSGVVEVKEREPRALSRLSFPNFRTGTLVEDGAGAENF
ncbi:hypothetical protein CQW23_25987 [Capsicum baccatum]|uniref:Uncharacterized protein n=1 Tax=Capsicum baccatum TaxID=33114 RepID=A0A2G2VMJ6_CAPBA|nr:hypothetical protein CQW23_25987 [Capsicum baccatum]